MNTPSEQLYLTKVAGKRTSPQKDGLELDFDAIQLTDQDLIDEWVTYQTMDRQTALKAEKRLKKAQLLRNQAEQQKKSLSPIGKRIIDSKEKLANHPLARTEIHHVHSILALCGMPYKRPPDTQTEYSTQYGYYTLNLQAGSLLDPKTGKWVPQGIPYGTKARLLQIDICTRALRQQSPEVEMDGSLTSFIHRLGFQVTGGKNGSVGLFKEQLQRLAACRIQMGATRNAHTKTINLQPIESFEVWFPNDPAQQMLWPSKVILSQKFYESLKDHALPVNITALSALSHSARQMDLLLWLSYRVKDLPKDYFLSWKLLKDQFCQSPLRRMIHFQRQFKEDLEHMASIFDRPLPATLTDKGMILHPCSPDKLFVPTKAALERFH